MEIMELFHLMISMKSKLIAIEVGLKMFDTSDNSYGFSFSYTVTQRAFHAFFTKKNCQSAVWQGQSRTASDSLLHDV